MKDKDIQYCKQIITDFNTEFNCKFCCQKIFCVYLEVPNLGGALMIMIFTLLEGEGSILSQM